MAVNLKNLDRWAAVTAQRIAQDNPEPDKLETWITKALGVLQSQGIYTAMLYLYANENSHTQKIRKELWDLLGKIESVGISWKDEEGKLINCPEVNAEDKEKSNNVLKFFSDAVASELETLLLVRDLYEQTLIYARYHAKAEENRSKQEKSRT